ncbi:phospholipid/cholesterol/gamma-HCH transport system substrate-binding protein [Mycobacterium sp. OAS707]|uniref:MCE family protein n=1 Tax=Mycobacterium sp. OAS707 TaxID=2663822 RepID=UPI001789F4D7|nr:phospholipid/cholesterol/gamma-HCH transport system substrate-binding protein [Mycobacterium sp. OAS707]
MRRLGLTAVKFGVFAAVMVVLTAGMFLIFDQYQTGAKTRYSAIFTDASSLRAGASVRMAGIRIGTVHRVSLRDDTRVEVDFDADRDVVLSVGTRAVVRYLNLVGDRYLELVDSPGATGVLPAGAQIPVERTAGALDLDLLLGGLKPVIQGLNPEDVNALTSSLIAVFQDQGDTVESLMSKSASFANTLADNSATVQAVIDNLSTTLATLSKDSDQFSTTIDRLQRLAEGLSKDRDPIGTAIESLNSGTASLADLLTAARPPLAGTVEQLSRLAPLLDQDKGRLETALRMAPDNYNKLIRTGAYGSFVNYYLCGVAFRVSDLQGRTAVFPMLKQEAGRCGEP